MKKVRSMFMLDRDLKAMCDSAIAYHADKGDLNADEAIMVLDVFVALIDTGAYVAQNICEFVDLMPQELTDRLLKLTTTYGLDSLDD